MNKYAVIGSPIDHSLSPQIHSIFAQEADIEISYEAIEVNKENFKIKVDELLNKGYLGLNVTLPIKEEAFNYAEVKSENASLTLSMAALKEVGGPPLLMLLLLLFKFFLVSSNCTSNLS